MREEVVEAVGRVGLHCFHQTKTFVARVERLFAVVLFEAHLDGHGLVFWEVQLHVPGAVMAEKGIGKTALEKA